MEGRRGVSRRLEDCVEERGGSCSCDQEVSFIRTSAHCWCPQTVQKLTMQQTLGFCGRASRADLLQDSDTPTNQSFIDQSRKTHLRDSRWSRGPRSRSAQKSEGATSTQLLRGGWSPPSIQLYYCSERWKQQTDGSHMISCRNKVHVVAEQKLKPSQSS